MVWFIGLSAESTVNVLNSNRPATPLLTFEDLQLRCDKSDPNVTNNEPWNWGLSSGQRIAVITQNAFVRYQLIGVLADLIQPVSGQISTNGVVGWPVGGEGGLDSKLRVSHGFEFLSILYGDCLSRSKVSENDFWSLLNGQEISSGMLIKELSKSQKDFFFLSLSVLFSFDLYLISRTKYLMSKAARPLRELLQLQLEGKTLLSTSPSNKFRREFCTSGLVLGPRGEVLFQGELEESIQWADVNLGAVEVSESDEESFSLEGDFKNSDAIDGQADMI